MIIDAIDNINLYKGLSNRLAVALEILTEDGLAEKADGRYEVDGDDIFYMIQRYKTLPLEEARLEAHRKYIDVQFVADGREVVGYAPTDAMQVCDGYNEDNDAAFYQLPDNVTELKLNSGMFCIFYPQDAHAPCRYTDSPSDVTKIVIKVKVDE
ncbi:MAG: YhcH/YjgK/YiaL family protein [Phycisphaerae bacterium]|nr:YhcH/YjgK/YiaL family protein [Phycisphaerae bacterium]